MEKQTFGGERALIIEVSGHRQVYLYTTEKGVLVIPVEDAGKAAERTGWEYLTEDDLANTGSGKALRLQGISFVVDRTKKG